MPDQDRTISQVFLNNATYSNGQEDPKEALKDALAFAVDDWGSTRAMSWVWGIVLGWDDEAMTEQAAKHRWSPEVVARLQRLHAAFGPEDDPNA